MLKKATLQIAYLLFVILLTNGMAFSQKSKTQAVKDKLYPAGQVNIDGYIGQRLDGSYNNRILAQDVDKLVNAFRTRTETSCWQSEFWGKWFTSAVLAYKYKPSPELKKKLDYAVSGLLSTQTPDGYIGNYAENRHLNAWDIWGRKYCMLGLISYYDLTGDKKALQAASKVADHLMKEITGGNHLIVKLGNHRGMAASSVLEPVCLLYLKTSDRKYLDFAEEIVRQWETPDGPQLISKSAVDVSKRFAPPTRSWYGWEQGQKAYEMMSCYEGLLELYRITGNQAYLNAVEATWENIKNNEINIVGSGSAMECWFHGKDHQTDPVHHYQETCVTATWIKLCQQLLRLTGDSKYADAIELCYYNALLGAMNHDGSDWAKYTPLFGLRLPGSEQCGMGLNCCVASGPRALFTFPVTVAMSGDFGIQVNFFQSGSYTVESPKKQQVTLVQETEYPVEGEVTIKMQMQKPETMALRIRIPSWSGTSAIKVNGQPVENPGPGKFIDMNRAWKNGDIIDLSFEMKGQVVRFGKLPEYVAVVRGPIVLTRDSRLGGPAVDLIITPVTEGRTSSIRLEPVPSKNPETWMEYSSLFDEESYLEGGSKPLPLNFCDYASAGNGKSSSQFRTWFPQNIDPRSLAGK